MKNWLILLAFCTIGAFAHGFVETFFKDYPNIINVLHLVVPFILGYIYHDITKEDK